MGLKDVFTCLDGGCHVIHSKIFKSEGLSGDGKGNPLKSTTLGNPRLVRRRPLLFKTHPEPFKVVQNHLDPLVKILTLFR